MKTVVIAISTAFVVLAIHLLPAAAANPTQADFDACNRAAQARVASPSAAPQTGGATGPSLTTPSGTPDTSAGVQPGGSGGKTGPMITGSARTPGAPGGVSQGTGAVASTTPSGAGGGGSDSLQGIAEASKDDPQFRDAYRQCMQQRGF